MGKLECVCTHDVAGSQSKIMSMTSYPECEELYTLIKTHISLSAVVYSKTSLILLKFPSHPILTITFGLTTVAQNNFLLNEWHQLKNKQKNSGIDMQADISVAKKKEKENQKHLKVGMGTWSQNRNARLAGR